MKRALLIAAATLSMLTPAAFAAEEVAATPEAVPTAEDSFVAQAGAGGGAAIGARAERPRMNLSDDQLERLRALKDKYFADNAGKKAQLSVLKNQLRSEMTKEDVSRSAVLGIQGQINSLKADLSNSHIAQMLDAQAIFTPEQRKMMHSRALRAGLGHHGKRGGHHGKRGGGCGGGMHGFRGQGGPGGPGGPGPGSRAEGPDAPEPNADV